MEADPVREAEFIIELAVRRQQLQRVQRRMLLSGVMLIACGALTVILGILAAPDPLAFAYLSLGAFDALMLYSVARNYRANRRLLKRSVLRS